MTNKVAIKRGEPVNPQALRDFKLARPKTFEREYIALFDKIAKHEMDFDALNERDRRRALLDQFWVRQGWYRIRRKRGTVLLKSPDWASAEARRSGTRLLAEQILRKPPETLIRRDFRDNRMDGLITFHNGSSFRAVSEAYPERGICEWQMTRTTRSFWKGIENRRKAAQWLLEKLHKKASEVTKRDFRKNGLGGLLAYYSSREKGKRYGTIARLFEELLPESEKRADFAKKEDRIAAIRRKVEEEKRDPRSLRRKDFQEMGLGGLLAVHYRSSPYLAVSEAYPELDIKRWEMPDIRSWKHGMPPADFFKHLKNRTSALEWLSKKLNKEKFTREEFEQNGLAALFDQIRYHTFIPLPEGKPISEVRLWPVTASRGFYESPQNRERALNWLAKETGKAQEDITWREFYNHGLGVLQRRAYNANPPEPSAKYWGSWRNQPTVSQMSPEVLRFLVERIGEDKTDKGLELIALLRKEFERRETEETR